jgi:tetratricopeptide (TPR) repeat protein
MKFSYMSLFIVCTLVIIALQPVVRAAPDQTGNPEYWYNKGVDLANGGKYDEALAATDHALALNASFICLRHCTGLIPHAAQSDLSADRSFNAACNSSIVLSL